MKPQLLANTFLATTILFSTASAAQIDADAAKNLASRNKCFRCHAVDKTKQGPSFKKVAVKYKNKSDGEEKLIQNITTGPKIKLEDGTEEAHKIIDTKDQGAIKNLVGWILSQ